MADSQRWTSERIISDVLGCAPDMEIGGEAEGWRLCRWRSFVGKYDIPALPDPLFTVHIGGKPSLKTWVRDGWSETVSYPGCVTDVPFDQPTGWLVDGELDMVTLSLGQGLLAGGATRERFRRMRFAFANPLGVALTRQILAELYAPPEAGRDAYMAALVGALQAHVLRGPIAALAGDIPVADFSAYRLHQAVGAIREHPEDRHSLEALSEQAGVTPSHFCRIFKKATGVSPHQYVMRARLERAKDLLAQSGLPLGAIADQLGFGSQSHFTRAFHKTVGLTPSEFRRHALGRLQ